MPAVLPAQKMTISAFVPAYTTYTTCLTNFAGAILTKMDGDSRGGAALSVKEVSGRPIKFVGSGEKLEALEPFFPDRIASRILGMGASLSGVALAVLWEALGMGLPTRFVTLTFRIAEILFSADATAHPSYPHSTFCTHLTALTSNRTGC